MGAARNSPSSDGAKRYPILRTRQHSRNRGCNITYETRDPHRALRLFYQELIRFRRANHLGADADLEITESESPRYTDCSQEGGRPTSVDDFQLRRRRGCTPVRGAAMDIGLRNCIRPTRDGSDRIVISRDRQVRQPQLRYPASHSSCSVTKAACSDISLHST